MSKPSSFLADHKAILRNDQYCENLFEGIGKLLRFILSIQPAFGVSLEPQNNSKSKSSNGEPEKLSEVSRNHRASMTKIKVDDLPREQKFSVPEIPFNYFQ